MNACLYTAHITSCFMAVYNSILSEIGCQLLAQNFRLTDVAVCAIHELFECIIYTMNRWELVHSAKWR